MKDKLLRRVFLFGLAIALALTSPARADLFLTELYGFGVGGGEGPLVARAVTFDGNNDYLLRGAGLTGASDGKQYILSLWMRLNGADGSVVVPFGNALGGVEVQRQASNKIRVGMFTPAGVRVLDRETAATFTSGATWIHILASGNAAAGVGQLYINDVSDSVTIGIDSNANIDFTDTDWAVAARPSGLQDFDGDLAELYFNTVTSLDLSVEANRRKFITATGKPENLGSDGSTPTGSAPIMYHSVRVGDAATAFATNRGTGGNFSITGTPSIAATSPSD